MKVDLEKIKDFADIVLTTIPLDLDEPTQDEGYENYKLIFDQELKLKDMKDVYDDDIVRVVIRKNIKGNYYWVNTYAYESNCGWTHYEDALSEKEIKELGGIEATIKELVIGSKAYFQDRGCSCATGIERN